MTQTLYTVKQLTLLAGGNPCTLHYYDQIGLLKSESRGRNGYSLYGDKFLLKLQQILFYRELGLSLESIKAIVTRPDFDVLTALESHRKFLQGRAERLERLIQTVGDTILHLRGEKEMSKKQLMDYFWTPDLDQLLAPAEGYHASLDFKANFDKIDPRLAAFMKKAVRVYVRRMKGEG